MMMLTFITMWILLFFPQSESNDDFQRLPKIPTNYRYFVGEFDKTYRILGSCTDMKKTVPMSRCIIKINHRYKLKYLSSSVVNRLIGSGTIIFKKMENNIPMITILTAFDIVVPQLDLRLYSFIVFSSLVTSMINMPLVFYYRTSINKYIGKMLLLFFPYVVILSCIIYYLICIIYPFMFNSSIEINLGIDDQIRLRSRAKQIQCEVISSRLILSNTWWDGIG